MAYVFRTIHALLPLTLVMIVSGGCAREAERSAPEPSAAHPAEDASALDPQIVHIPIGEFTLGSRPGEPGRQPPLEPRATSLRLGPFRMDSHLFKGKDGQPQRAVSRDEAETLCATAQGRLCSEAEWERACRGPSSTLYPSGETPCPKQGNCRSGFDVLQMTQSFEWTASTFGRDSSHGGEPVVRGAGPDTPPTQRRCAARSFPEKKPGTTGAAPPTDIGFRCCYGAPNASTIREPALGPAYQQAQLSVPELRALLRSDPRTAPYANEAQFFKSDAAATVLARGPGDNKGFTLTTEPLIWQPSAGTSFLVVAGHDSHRTSFVVVYYDYNSERKLAGSFIMDREPGPVALAYAESIRPRLHISTCWGCPGETGKVLFREPEEVVLLQP